MGEATEVAYYPGCSAHATAREYDDSIRLVCKRLGMVLREVEDWNCCGATAAHGADHILSVGLGARNLSLVEAMGLTQMATPCAGCFAHLKTASSELASSEAVRSALARRASRPLPGPVEVVHLLQLLVQSVGLDRIGSEVRRPLTGMKLAAYYGCLLTRPTEVMQFDDPEQPRSMDDLLAALGAQNVVWSHKAECCGGGFAASKTDIVLDLSAELLEAAAQAGAQAIVVGCPLCQANLDTRQAAIEVRSGRSYGLPVMYFTQLMGLAFGFSHRAVGLGRLLVDPRPLLRSWGAVK